jgi:NADH:ubiquinone oxidoreductase subunit 3 (subunit A)
MIQRPQTLLLIGVVLFMMGSLFLKSWQKEAKNSPEKAFLTAYEMRYVAANEQDNKTKSVFYLAGLAVVAAGLATYSIMSYRSRMKQLKIGAFISVLIAFYAIVVIWHSSQAQGLFEPDDKGEYGLGFYLPLGAFVCNMIANRLIQRDEKLVRSMDKLR